MKRATEAVLAIVVVVLLYQVLQHRRAVMAINDRLLANTDSLTLVTLRNRTMNRFLTSAQLPAPAVINGYSDGKPVVIDLSATDSTTLLFMLDQACAACLRAIPFVVGLAKAQNCPLRTVALSVNPVANERFPQPVGASPDMMIVAEFSGWVIQALPTNVSPATVVLGRRGLIHGIWVGDHDARVRAEIDHSVRGSCALE